MSRFSVLFLVSLGMGALFLDASIVQAQVVQRDNQACFYQLRCERQAIIFNSIDDARMRAYRMNNPEIMQTTFESLDAVRVSAQAGYLGKSLMLLAAINRTISRQTIVDAEVEDLEDSHMSTSSDDSVTTTTSALLSEVADIDKNEIILSF